MEAKEGRGGVEEEGMEVEEEEEEGMEVGKKEEEGRKSGGGNGGRGEVGEND